MDTQAYLKHIKGIATDLAAMNDMTSLGRELAHMWSEIEINSKIYGYDIFADDDKLRADVSALASLLYRVPGANPDSDCNQIYEKNREYGGSWKTRGGVGAFMMLARKWDRVAVMLKQMNLARAIETDRREEGILDDLGDLRRYLLLVLAEHVAIEIAKKPQMDLPITSAEF